MKVYLAGPMQGYPQFNFPAFHKAAAYLRSQGYEVFSPAEKDIETHGKDISKENATGSVQEAVEKHGFSMRRALADDTQYICLESEGIVMMPGWENSKGAFAEWALTRALSHPILYLNSTLDGLSK